MLMAKGQTSLDAARGVPELLSVIGSAKEILILPPRQPYLPSAIRGDLEGIEGAVMSKQRKGDRLLLTVQTSEGAILATFKKKLTEIDLLVAEGDMLTLARTGYRAFMEDPPIGRVRKQNHRQPQRLDKPLLSDTTDKSMKGQVLQ